MKNKRNDLDELKKVQRDLIKENSKTDSKNRSNIYSIVLILLLVLLILFCIWYKKEKDVKVSETNNGKYEIYTETQGYVLNTETLVEYDKNETLIPIAESEKRITINSVIGIYKNKQYESSLAELAKTDEEINEKIKLLPEVYSNDVISIEEEINSIVKKIKNVTSYIEMGDYKTKLDNLAYDKALTVSTLTPSGSDVKSLILKRDEYRENMNKSSNNVKSPISGIILYKNDGLENKFKITDVNNLSQQKIEEIMTEYNKTPEETFGIKIVDNYESYMIVKEDMTNDKYITENKIYTIQLLEKNIDIKGLLVKKISDEKCNYCVFKINNYIENIADFRKTDVKVIWQEVTGFVVSNKSIKNINNIDYVTILSLNKYIDIPVKKVLKLDNLSLVDNYSDDEKTKLNLTETRSLAVYDRVVENK